MHIQTSLFAKQAQILFDDPEGGMVYHPACVAPARAQRWFDALLRAVPWRSLRRPMYARVVDVPRLVANVSLRDPSRPACLDAACAAVMRVAPAPYTHVGLNLYRDARDSVALHGDREGSLCPGQPIAILSLGAPRSMQIRDRAAGVSRRITLEPGSVLVMSHASQSTHEHGIPKCPAAAGSRISLAFRVRRQASVRAVSG